MLKYKFVLLILYLKMKNKKINLINNVKYNNFSLYKYKI